MWIDEIKKKTTSEVSILLVGNKNDLGNSIVVSYDEGKELADRLGVKFFETSAKNGFNIEEAFTAIVSDILGIKFLEDLQRQPKTLKRLFYYLF
jgi:GTPase SAR1 family protein